MKTAGVVFDFYDDITGALLKEAFPSAEELPEIIKEAHILNAEERGVLRDEAFGLVMQNEGRIMRKFACVDAGNTLLSLVYFEKTASRLPEEAREAAARALYEKGVEFGLIEGEEKTASKKDSPRSSTGMGRTRDSMQQPLVGDEADWSARTNILSVRGGADSGRVLPTVNQIKTAAPKLTGKALEAVGKTVGDGFRSGNYKAVKGIFNTPENNFNKFLKGKIQSGEHGTVRGIFDKHLPKEPLGPTAVKLPIKIAEAHGGGETLTTDKRDASTKTTNPMVQNRKVPIVDVTGKDPAQEPIKGGVVEKKAASRYALGDRYPLDNMADVVKAVDYWQQNYLELEPIQRREYAVKTAARAEELGIGIDYVMAKYAGSDYAADVDAHLATRRAVTTSDNHEMYEALQEKRAHIEPEVFAQLLGEADQVAGLDGYYGGDVQDPYFSTFGDQRQKTKEASWSWESRVGDYVTADQLNKLARNGRPLVHKHFDSDLTNAFCKNPVTIFESLPDDTKAIIARLAADEYDGLKTN